MAKGIRRKMFLKTAETTSEGLYKKMKFKYGAQYEDLY